MSSKMLSAMAVALPLAAALPSSTHPHLAIPSFARDSGKIVGGELADEGEFPYIVSLQGPSLCGGSLLDARTIITAAHCFDPETHTPEEFSARAGSNFMSTGGQLITVASVVNHPEYDPDTQANDLAIWKLSEPFEESEFISFISLPELDFDPAPDSNLNLAGWGGIESGGPLSEELLKVTVPIVDREQCAVAYADDEGDSVINETMFCAGLPEGGKDSCQGDSGGPAVNDDGVLVGVVSWGVGCALPDFPGVYTRISIMLDFIVANWKPHCRV